MASADQLKALLKSYLGGNDDHFFSVAMQVAAHEARLGHGKLAGELRDMIDEAKNRRGTAELVPISRPRGELTGLLEISYPKIRLADIILENTLAEQIKCIIREQRHASQILDHGLFPMRKLLLIGSPGTGKTMTASILAGELGLPLLQVRLDGLITKYMGETAAKLRQIFDTTNRTRGVYFFDEFDAIGAQRGLVNDTSEIRRVLNSFLLMIEQDSSHSLIVAATNHPDVLDSALFRRYDDILHYRLPDQYQVIKLLKTRLSGAVTKGIRWQALAELSAGLSYAEIAHAINDALKNALIHDRGKLCETDIRAMLIKRQDIAKMVATKTT